MSPVQIYHWVHDKKMESLPYKYGSLIEREDLFKVAEEVVSLGFHVMLLDTETLFIDTKHFSQR